MSYLLGLFYDMDSSTSLHVSNVTLCDSLIKVLVSLFWLEIIANALFPKMVTFRLIFHYGNNSAGSLCQNKENVPSLRGTKMKSMEVLEKALALLAHKDLDGFIALLSVDCVIVKDDGEVLARGTEQLRKFYLPIFGEQADMKIELGDVFSTGSVIAAVEINRDMVVDGVKKDLDTVWIYKVINDKIAYMHVFTPDQDSSETLDSLTS